jgi:PII-like signaling protein
VTRIHEQETLARIFIGEADHYRGRPLYEAIVYLAREMKLAGATVLRGVTGYGARSVIHTSRILRLSEDLPIIVEVVDRRETLDPFLERVEAMIEESEGGALITLEKAEVICYRPG